jgi:hypothetical protein
MPTFAPVRGILDILFPGVFLLFNLVLCIYLVPYTDEQTKSFLKESFSRESFVLLGSLTFGYLLGVLLRLVRVETADRWSGRFWAKGVHVFPYFKFLEGRCKKYLPEDVQRFYELTWGKRVVEKSESTFFNFCKVIINSVDQRAGNEIDAAEAITRYTASMFYALLLSTALLLVTTALVLWHSAGREGMGLIYLMAVYGVAAFYILRRLRLIRVKEAMTVFFASYLHRDVIFPEKPSGDIS